jgi:UDP-N-acetylglucosamine:LPS N-acetylglucosamine transferase
MSKVMFISGSIGLGHVTRDLAIAREMKKIDPGVEIIWAADPPASGYLKAKGYKVLDYMADIPSPSILSDGRAKEFTLSLGPWFMEWYKSFPERAHRHVEAIKQEKVDLVVGDETYDLYCQMQKEKKLKTFPFVLILDFIGTRIGYNEEKGMGAWFFNKWTAGHVKQYYGKEGTIFIGEADDIKGGKLGFLLPDRTDLAKKLDCVGYAIDFDPTGFRDQSAMKKELGYGPEPLIIATIGGTGAGRPLLDLAAASFPKIKEAVPDARMVVVCGPNVDAGSIKVSDGIEVKGLVPDLYKHMAAADLVICCGGGTTTLELQSLQRPFLYFPLLGHFEQQIDVAYHLDRDHVGVRMDYSKTTPDILAAKAVETIGKPVKYPEVSRDGARKAAEHIMKTLDKVKKGELAS